MLTLSPDVYWRIPNADWRAHLELCNKNLDTLKGPDAMQNQSRDPTQVRTSAHLSKLYSQNSGASTTDRNIPLLTDELLRVTSKCLLKWTITKFKKKYLISLTTEICHFAIKSEKFCIYCIEMIWTSWNFRVNWSFCVLFNDCIIGIKVACLGADGPYDEVRSTVAVDDIDFDCSSRLFSDKPTTASAYVFDWRTWSERLFFFLVVVPLTNVSAA